MQTSSFTNPPLQINQNFSDFEKEALGETALKTIESNLQQCLRKFHLQQMKDLEERMVSLEKRCVQKIQKSIEKNVKLQLETQFQKVVEACQKDITQMSSPLFKRAEKDVQSLTYTVHHDSSSIYPQMENPFLVLIGTAGLAGASMGLVLLLLQVPFLSVFLMNAQTREAYEIGLRVIKLTKELEAQRYLRNNSLPY